MARLREISPIARLKPGMELPPFMLLHGDADDIVPYDHSVRMVEELEKCGADAELVTVPGAPHEGSFWSLELLEYVFGFIRRNV
jgi:predicted esterase